MLIYISKINKNRRHTTCYCQWPNRGSCFPLNLSERYWHPIL